MGTVWQAGATVGRYLLLTPIAEGGMAQLWLARQTGMQGFDRLVVIKRMVDALEADPEHVEMFLTEARLAARLNHPNISQIFELGEDHGTYFIAMEYLDGENLSYLRRAAVEQRLFMPDPLAARVIALAAEGLHHAHTALGLDGRPLGVVHRDVSPQNVFVTYQGAVKVLDFGVAKLVSQATTTGKLKGKLAYLSPEQARAEPLDARSDVFALGVVLFELITRTRLVARGSEVETLTVMAGSEPFPLASERRPDVPAGLVEIIARAIERRADDRYQSARELGQALEDWIQTTSGRASPADLAAYLERLCGHRILERRRLMDAALQLEASPSNSETLREIASVIHSTSGSSKVNKPQLPETKRSPRRALLVGAGLAITAIVAAWGIGAASKAGPGLTGGKQGPPTVREMPATPPATPPVAVAPEPTRVIIDTQPSGATLTLDGEPRGHTPLTLARLPLGEHTLVAALDGYQPATRAVNIERPGQQVDLTVALVKQPEPAPPAAEPVDPAPESAATAAKKSRAPRAVGKLSLKTEP